MLGAFHTACGALALLLGVWIFLTEKGTRRHLRIGWAYVGSMACLNGSALVIYRLTGGFNMFHALAIFSLTTVGIGVAQVRWRYRPPNWLWRHYQYMSWSYVGLLAATCNEAFVRVPLLIGIVGSTTNGGLPLIASGVIVAASALIIFAVQRRTLASQQRADAP